MFVKRVVIGVVALLLSIPFTTNSPAQFSASILYKQAIDTCGGWDLYRLIARITLSRSPKSLQEAERAIDRKVSEQADPVLMFSNAIVSVLERSGDTIRCGYVSRHGTCYEDGFRILSGSIHLFSPNIRSTLQMRNTLLKVIWDRYQQVSFSYNFTPSAPSGSRFKSIRFSVSDEKSDIFDPSRQLTDTLYFHRFIGAFYCDLHLMESSDMQRNESDILSIMNSLLMQSDRPNNVTNRF